MRTVLVTGPGGAGRSTAAAATALHSARSGARTLLVRTDRDQDRMLTPARGLPGPPGSQGSQGFPDERPAEAGPGLFTLSVDPAGRFRTEAGRFQERTAAALEMLGVVPLDPEELTEPPGSGGLALLKTLRDQAATGDWDAVVVDCPPVTETVKALALPEQLRRYLDRILPAERQAARALRPLLASLAGVPMPAEWLYSAAALAEGGLAAAQALVEDSATTVRLVVEPGPLATARVRAARAWFALYGHRLEAVLANRVLPAGTAGSPDAWFAALAGQQRQELKALRAECGDVPVHELRHLGRDPVGGDDLAALADDGALEIRPCAGGPAPEPWSVEEGPDAGPGRTAGFVWRLPLPGAERPGFDLVRRGDELVVDVGPHRRIVPLPSGLRRCTVTGAALKDGDLIVRFAPDPGLWPGGDGR